MSSLVAIHNPVQSQLAAVRVAALNDRFVCAALSTGVPDAEQCGIELGVLVQLCAGPGVSSGRTALLFSAMAQFTRCDHFCALVDADDCFDPVSAQAAGVELDRVLWVRCGEGAGKKLNRLEQAFKAADILVQNGGFQLIVVDLSKVEERRLRNVPLTTWFRFARVAEKMQTALVFLTNYPAAQSCAGLTLHMNVGETRWLGSTIKQHGSSGQKEHPLAYVLEGAECKVEIGRRRKPVQSVKPDFTAAASWK